MIDRRTRTVATALRVTLAACVTTTLIGCATKPGGTIEPTREGKVERSAVLHSLALDRALSDLHSRESPELLGMTYLLRTHPKISFVDNLDLP